MESGGYGDVRGTVDGETYAGGTFERNAVTDGGKAAAPFGCLWTAHSMEARIKKGSARNSQ
jgi:hypothetical protein